MGNECSVGMLLLDHSYPADFGECMCQKGCNSFSASYLFIRDLFVQMHFLVLLFNITLIFSQPDDKVYLFFDFWNEALVFFTSELAVYSVIERWSECEMDENCCWEYMPWHSRLYWAFFSAMLPSTVISTAVFWKYRYQRIISKKAKLWGIIMSTYTPAIVIIDFLLVSFPLRLFHVIYFILWYALYVGVTAAFQYKKVSQVGDLVPVYEKLDWDEPKEALSNAAYGLSAGVGVYFVFWVLSRMKELCRKPCPYE